MFILFETMLDCLKWQDKQKIAEIEALEKETEEAYQSNKDANLVLSTWADYVSKNLAWHDQAFEKMHPFVHNWKEDFHAYISFTKKEQERHAIAKNLLYNEYAQKCRSFSS